MLLELRIRNFAVIDDVTVRPNAGLTVLTGETGAGKSIIVDALSLLLGGRASSDVVRVGAKRATVEGAFEVRHDRRISSLLEERGVEMVDGMLVLKREVAAEGRNRAWINGSPAAATVVGEIGRLLVDLHGQHEHQSLLDRVEQRAILDAFGAHQEVALRVSELHGTLREARREFSLLDRRIGETRERADLLRFVSGEIGSAAPEPGEDERLEAEVHRLSHAEELLGLAGGIARTLDGAEHGVLDRLGALRRDIERLARLDPARAELSELFDTAYYATQELANRSTAYGSEVEHDPARLEEARGRQDRLFRLKRKYGPTLQDVIRRGEEAGDELSALDRSGLERTGHQDRERALESELRGAAAELTAARERAGKALAAEMERLLPDLGMEGGTFQVSRAPLDRPGPGGAEEIEFRAALNRGFTPRPLSRVASGGELSRVMLALKTILARLDGVPTLIFDEVDAGIGGEVGVQVGVKMRQVAADHQVFAISHLPQIAARAHHHLRVRKRTGNDGLAAAEVEPLEGETRLHELARMLGGDPERPESLEHARAMLAAATD